MTRPVITYAVHVFGQFVSEPQVEHWDELMHVLRYLKGCLGKGIILESNCDIVLRAYCDADWTVCLLTRKSVTGSYVQFALSHICWRSKK